MRKIIIIVLSVFLLASCAQAVTPEAPAVPVEQPAAPVEQPVTEEKAPEAPAAPEPVVVDPVTIEFWHSLSGDFGNVLNQLVIEYNEIQDDVTVIPVYKGNYQDTQKALLAALAANTPPDISMLEVSFSTTLAAKGVLKPVQDFIDDPEVGLPEEEANSIYDGFKKAVSMDGKMYPMPFNMSIPVLYYNKDMLDAAGIAAPETWEDFESACNAVTAGEQFGFTLNPGNVWIWEAMVMQNGGELFNEDYTEVRFNQEAAVGSLQFIRNLVDSGCAKTQAWEEGRTNFFNGKVAFMEDSSGSLSGVLNSSDFNVGVTHLPWGKEKVVTIGGATLGIFLDIPTEKQLASWAFIKHMAAPESISRLSADTGYMPTSSLAMELDPLKSLLASDPLRASILESLPFTSPRPQVEGYAEISNFLRQAIEFVGLQQLSAQEALDEAALDRKSVV